MSRTLRGGDPATRPLALRITACALVLIGACGIPLAGGAHTVEGRVVHEERPTAVGGLEVRLLGVVPGGSTVQRSARTDAEGRFRFPDLETGTYFVVAEYAGITYPGGRAAFEESSEGAPAERTQSISLRIYESSEEPEGLQLTSVRWILEREAGTYRLSTRATVRNATNRAIEVPEDAVTPVRIPLAHGHRELETMFGHTLPGASVFEGHAEFRGPFLPGDRDYVIAYDLASDGPRLATELSFGPAPQLAVDFVELLVRDFGVRVDIAGLHPARAARERDEFYLRWIGFGLGAGARVPLELAPLPPFRPLPAPARALLMAALAAGAIGFVLRPLTAGAPEAGAARGGIAESPEQAEREAVIAALVDLEHDFETGKISSEDRDRLRGEVRREAQRSLRRVARPKPAAEPEPGVAAAPEPCDCGRLPQAEDRFCASCGKALCTPST